MIQEIVPEGFTGFRYYVEYLPIGALNPLAAKIQFYLDYPCWCELEKSDIWHQLENEIREIQVGTNCCGYSLQYLASGRCLPLEVRVQFCVPYSCLCELETSQTWRRLGDLVRGHQTEYTHFELPTRGEISVLAECKNRSGPRTCRQKAFPARCRSILEDIHNRFRHRRKE